MGVPLVPGTGEVTVQDRIIRLVYRTYVYHEYFHVLCVYYIVLCVYYMYCGYITCTVRIVHVLSIRITCTVCILHVLCI